MRYMKWQKYLDVSHCFLNPDKLNMKKNPLSGFSIKWLTNCVLNCSK